MLTGEESRLSLRYVGGFESVVFLRISIIHRTVVWLARISVWGVAEVAGAYPRLSTLSLHDALPISGTGLSLADAPFLFSVQVIETSILID